MFDKLNQFFGQDQGRADDYRDFEQRVRDDPDSISDAEAARRYREMMAQQDDAQDDPTTDAEYEEVFARMSPDERRELARRYMDASRDKDRPFDGYRDEGEERAASPRELGRMTRQASRQDPDLLEGLLGQGSPLTSTGGKIAMAGLAALAARKFLSKR